MPEIKINDFLNKAYIKERPERNNFNIFKDNMVKLIKILETTSKENEDTHKKDIENFLENTYYSGKYRINKKGNIDTVIFHSNDPNDKVGVIIETKIPNSYDMVKKDDLNKKSMQQLLWYYLNETEKNKNNEVKTLIVTTGFEWYIFDAVEFYEHFSKNRELIKEYKYYEVENIQILNNTTKSFYDDVAFKYIKKVKDSIKYVYINIKDYVNILENTNEEYKLIDLYKLLSPQSLLKIPAKNDSNILNQKFYHELLYILGLTEIYEEGKIKIGRFEKEKRQMFSLLENTMFQLSEKYSDENIVYNISFDLIITWINRILFLKLLEAQQIKYQDDNKKHEFAFLNIKTVKDFNELNTLFFHVLAVENKKRDERFKDNFKNIPYLNSSLFERTINEDKIEIRALENKEMDVFSSSVLNDEAGNKRTKEIKLLEYIFEFLDAYDFSSNSYEKIQKKHKTLINASVLGLIFEKINGYNDGSYFTPGFITSHICSETIKNIVINKFNEMKSWKAETLTDIYNFINSDKNINAYKEANDIINSIKILDPAVGSGHFLVSALNELIAIKRKLGILIDNEGKILLGKIQVLNDELIVYDEADKYFEYKLNISEKQRIQETLFNEKRHIIENCLFGVDINPNSVKICRLRLWIELLKHSYYKKESGYKELETLPNLDINIQQGDSLISRFRLDVNINDFKYNIKELKEAAQDYKSSNDKTENRKLLEKIKKIKTDFSENLTKQNNLYTIIKNLESKLAYLDEKNIELEFITEKQNEEINKKRTKINNEIFEKNKELSEFLSGDKYDIAFEWRFQFPEVLDNDGNYIGFDAVIGNPPYLREGKISKDLFAKHNNSPYYQGKMDLWYIFACVGVDLLKKNGILSFIATNNWTTAAGAGKLRNYIIENTKILKLIDFTNFMIFENASIQTMVMSFLKDNKINNYNIDYRKLVSNAEIVDVQDLLDKKMNNKTIYLSPTINRDNLKNKFLTFSPDDTILNKIAGKGICLTENELAQGIVPNPDIVNNRNISLIPNIKIAKYKIKVGDGVFVIDNSEFKNISTDEKKYIKPLYEPTEIEKYIITKSLKNILYITKKNYKNDAPKLLEHLEKYREIMDERRENKNGRLDYFHLHWSRDLKYFKKGIKILVLRKCIQPVFAYTEKETFVMMAVNVIKTTRFDNKYLVGLLNSKLIAFWLKNKGKMQGENYQLDKEPLLQIPIFEATEAQQKPIIALVDKILTAKNENLTVDTSKYEKEIDNIVYTLYQLTPNEIEIIKNN
jgi:adenine-specific DNA-methyltransferase